MTAAGVAVGHGVAAAVLCLGQHGARLCAG